MGTLAGILEEEETVRLIIDYNIPFAKSGEVCGVQSPGVVTMLVYGTGVYVYKQ